jgi:hypothetical protein
VVTEGTLTLRSFGPEGVKTVRLGPGESIGIGSMEPHNYSNESDGAVRFLVVLGETIIQFFREIGKDSPPAPGAEPDFAAIAGAMARHGITMVTAPG